jgi:hypothetical protein
MGGLVATRETCGITSPKGSIGVHEEWQTLTERRERLAVFFGDSAAVVRPAIDPPELGHHSYDPIACGVCCGRLTALAMWGYELNGWPDPSTLVCCEAVGYVCLSCGKRIVASGMRVTDEQWAAAIIPVEVG